MLDFWHLEHLVLVYLEWVGVIEDHVGIPDESHLFVFGFFVADVFVTEGYGDVALFCYVLRLGRKHEVTGAGEFDLDSLAVGCLKVLTHLELQAVGQAESVVGVQTFLNSTELVGKV